MLDSVMMMTFCSQGRDRGFVFLSYRINDAHEWDGELAHCPLTKQNHLAFSEIEPTLLTSINTGL